MWERETVISDLERLSTSASALILSRQNSFSARIVKFGGARVRNAKNRAAAKSRNIGCALRTTRLAVHRSGNSSFSGLPPCAARCLVRLAAAAVGRQETSACAAEEYHLSSKRAADRSRATSLRSAYKETAARRFTAEGSEKVSPLSAQLSPADRPRAAGARRGEPCARRAAAASPCR